MEYKALKHTAGIRKKHQ